MIDSLADIMGKRNYDEPPEVTAIKKYILDKYNAHVAVTVQPQQFVITVSSSALAGTLRLELHQIKRQAGTDKRLTIRIR